MMRRISAAFESQSIVGLLSNLATVWTALSASILVLSATGSGMGAVDGSGPRSAPWTPPGEFIGAVWAVLYTLMAFSLWRINFVSGVSHFYPRLAVVTLIAFCLAWPFYAFDTPSRWPGLLGNLGIFALALTAMLRLWSHAPAAAMMIAPTALWIAIASAAIVDGAFRYGW